MLKQLLLLSLFALAAFSLQAQGIDFFKDSFAAAKAEAAAQDKLIFVDAYAVWCGPCKRMAAQVFPDEKVGAFFNRNFVSLKIDMEAAENEAFRREYPVSAFPTLFFLKADGTIVQQVKGALDVASLINAGEKALASAEPTEDYAAAYEAGQRDPELIYKYVRALIRSGEPHLRIANEYLRDQSDLNSKQNLEFLLLAATEADSRVFTMMTDRQEAIIALKSADVFTSQVYSACQATVKKAIEYSMESLLEEATEKMATFVPEKATAFTLESQMAYARAHNDAKTFSKAAASYAKEVISEDADKLESLALDLANTFEKDSRALKVAQELAEEAVALGEGYRYSYSLAIILKQAGKYREARAAAERALAMAREQEPRAASMLESFLEQLTEEG
jgi:thioredoxin-related protein